MFDLLALLFTTFNHHTESEYHQTLLDEASDENMPSLVKVHWVLTMKFDLSHMVQYKHLSINSCLSHHITIPLDISSWSSGSKNLILVQWPLTIKSNPSPLKLTIHICLFVSILPFSCLKFQVQSWNQSSFISHYRGMECTDGCMDGQL